MSMERFKPPTAADEKANCLGCWTIKHYTDLDDDGLCERCRHEPEQKENEMNYKSETDKARHLTSPYCSGNGIDLGSGGDPVVPHAIQFDRTHCGHINFQVVQIAGDIRTLPFSNESLDFVFSSHALEDFPLDQWVNVLSEWTRVLKRGGHIVLQAPDHERFREAVRSGRNGDNKDHKHEPHLGELTEFFQSNREPLGEFVVVMEKFEPEDDYNIVFVARKL